MTTNYYNTFIAVADDCPALVAEVPAASGGAPTVAHLQYQLLFDCPYRYTQDDLLFEVFAARRGIPAKDLTAERERFFGRDQACLRASPLSKRYGWGFHHDDEGRVALVGRDSRLYLALVCDPEIKQLKALRSRREPQL